MAAGIPAYRHYAQAYQPLIPSTRTRQSWSGCRTTHQHQHQHAHAALQLWRHLRASCPPALYSWKCMYICWSKGWTSGELGGRNRVAGIGWVPTSLGMTCMDILLVSPQHAMSSHASFTTDANTDSICRCLQHMVESISPSGKSGRALGIKSEGTGHQWSHAGCVDGLPHGSMKKCSETSL